MSRPLPSPQLLPGPYEGSGESDDIHHLIARITRTYNVLRRRWHVVLLVAAIGSAAVFVRLSLLPPRFVGEGLIQVGMNTEGAAAEEFRGTGLAKQVFNTQLKLLSSREVMLKALARSNLRDAPKEGEALEDELEDFRDEIKIRPLANTFLVEVTSWGPKPDEAALRVNALMEVFVTTSNEFVGSRYLGEEQQAKAKEADLRKKLTEAQAEQEALRVRTGNVQFKELRDALNVRNQQIERRSVGLSLERIAVVAEKKRLEPNLTDSQDSLELMVGRLPALEQYQGLLTPLRDAEAELEQLSAVHLRNHPKRQAAEKDVQSQRRLARLGVQGASRVRSSSLGERLATLAEEQRRLDAFGKELEVEFQALEKLEREARRLAGLVEWHEKELEATRAERWRAGGRSKVQMAAAIVSRSDTPSRPVSRLSPLVITGTLLGMFLLGVIVASVLDQLADRVIDSEALLPAGLPVLGRIPSIDLKGRSEASVLDELVRGDLSSPTAESFRLLRTNLTFALPSEGPRTVLVTSSAPKEGKTLISLQLALVLAPAGGRTLLVEADMRNPRIQKALEVVHERGLSDVLLGSAELEAVLQPTRFDGVTLLPSGACPPNPGDVLAGSAFADVLRQARAEFDCVVIDTPPVCGLADTSLMAAHGCAVLYVIRLDQTGQRLLEGGLKQLSASGVTPVGCVINSSSQRGGYGRHAYGYGRSASDVSARVGPPPGDA